MLFITTYRRHEVSYRNWNDNYLKDQCQNDTDNHRDYRNAN